MIYGNKSLKFSLYLSWIVNCITAILMDMPKKQEKGMANIVEQTGEQSIIR